MSIKNILILSFLLVAIMIGLLGGLAFYHTLEQAEPVARHEAGSVAKTVAILAEDFVEHIGPLSAPATRGRLQDLVHHFKSMHDRDIVIIASDRTIIADAVPAEIGTRFLHDRSDEVGQTLHDGRARAFTEVSAAYPQGIKQLAIPLYAKDSAIAGAVVLEYTPLYTEILNNAKKHAWLFFLYYLAALLTALGGGYLMHRHITFPLLAIQQAALKVAAGDLKTRIPTKRRDELGSLAASFNTMTTELGRSQGNLIRSHQQLEQEIMVRRQAEAGLTTALERVQAEKSKTDAVLEGLGVGLIIQDLEYRVVYENELQQSAQGRHTGELCFQAYEQSDHICDDCPMVRSLNDGTVHRAVRKVATEIGDVYFELISSPLRDPAGTIIGGIKITKDITDTKRSEMELLHYRSRLEELVTQQTSELSFANDQLRHAQKMEAVGRLAGGIAHDFNNILSAIMNCATILQMEIEEDRPVRQFVDQILASSDRAAHLTRSLLAFSRKQVMNIRLIDLNATIRQVKKLLTRLIREDIELVTDLVDDRLTIMADTGQIEQVLMNLVTNARDAMPGGGRLTIGSERRVLNEEFIRVHGYGTPGTYAVISVTDTGHGIAEDVLGKVFEPFFTTKEIGKGTGLGLSIVYGIVKQHNGYITVSSGPQGGTQFMLYLPLVESTISDEQGPRERPLLPRGVETILVAEDDTEVRELNRYFLEKFGYRVIEARDGDDTVNLFREHEHAIDLVMLDMIMPGKSGKVVYDIIRRHKPDVKVLWVSGYAADLMQQQGLVPHEMDILFKPLSPNEMLRRVRSALDSTSQPQPGRALS